MKKTPKELVGGQGKSPIEKGFKDHQLTGVGGGEELPIGGTPPDERLLWKHLVVDHPKKVLLHHCRLHPHLLGMRDNSHCEGEKQNLGARQVSREAEGPNQAAAQEKGASAADLGRSNGNRSGANTLTLGGEDEEVHA